MTALPSYIDPELWSAFIDNRKEMAKKRKEAFTPRAELLLVKKMMKFHDEGFDPNSSLESAITNSWKDLYRQDRYKTEPQKNMDPALLKIMQDEKKAAPMPEAVREKLAQLRFK